MKKKLLVLGGTGFLGHNFLKSFTDNNYQLLSVSSKKPKKKNKLKHVKYIICDISQKKNLKKNLSKDYFYVINFSGNIDHNNFSNTRSVHYIGLKNLLSYLDLRKIKLFIQASSCLEYGKKNSPQIESMSCNPKSFYGKAKNLSTKLLIKHLKYKAVILRLYQIYGPYQKFDRLIPFVIRCALKGKRFNCTSGKQLRDFLYINDLIDLINIILKSNKIYAGIYNVGYGFPIKVFDLIKLIVKKIKNGHPVFGAIDMRRDEILSLYPDISKLKKKYKWKPKTDLNYGLTKTINFYKKLLLGV